MDTLQLLASGFCGSVYALNEFLVVKEISLDSSMNCWVDTYQDTKQLLELEALKWANDINTLVVKYLTHSQDNEYMNITMERIFPVLPTAFSAEELLPAIELAEQQLLELHATGMAHGDLKRPSEAARLQGKDAIFNNIVITEVQGKPVIRFIDLGLAVLEQYDYEDDFPEDEGVLGETIEKDLEDWEAFKEWLLNYPRRAK